MNYYLSAAAVGAITFAFVSEAAATEWNVSVWGKRRAFTEHAEKLAELVSEKTGGEFTMNVSYGGLSKNRENLDGISIGAFEMAQFCALDYPVLVGISRKSLFGLLLGREVEDRLVASTSAVVIAYHKGARFFRVHDVAETCDALKLCEAIK